MMSQKSNQSRTSFAQKLRKEALNTRNQELKMKPVASQPGQLETTEEVLRKHYYMAKATKKTQLNLLEKEMSPQKHIIKSLGPIEEESHHGLVSKERAECIDQLQTQAASLMRLNAAWGLESKGPQIDRHRARDDPEKQDQGGVFTDVLDGMQQISLEVQSTMTDLDAMIHFYLQ